MGAPGSVNIAISKCGCGDPVCDQYTLSNQGTVGFTAEDAHQLAASGAMYEALEAELADLNEDIRWADDGDLSRLIKRRERMEAALALARGESQ